MKKIFALLAMFAITSSVNEVRAVKTIEQEDDIPKEKEFKLKAKERKIALSHGLKEFNIYGVVVFASNIKVAEKKVRKIAMAEMAKEQETLVS